MVKKKDMMGHEPQAELDSIGKDEAMDGAPDASALDNGEPALDKVTADIDQVLDLGTSLTIAEVTEWHSRFASAFERGSTVELKGAGIEQIDGAGVQLLAAAMKEAVAQHVEVSWSTVSETLQQAVSQLGLESVFNFQKDLP